MPLPLLTTHDATGHVHLIVGSTPLASARCAKSLDAGARPVLIAPANSSLQPSLLAKIEQDQVQWIRRAFIDDDLQNFGRNEVGNVVDAVFVTLGPKTPLSTHISTLCRSLRIPVNVADAPSLCTFTLLSTYTDGPLQIGITTNGNGCKLASRIRREIAASLPTDLGKSIARLGSMRRRIWEEDQRQSDTADVALEQSDDDSPAQKSNFNKLVLESDNSTARTRRMRWLSQICEYWPLQRLAATSESDIDDLLHSYADSKSPIKSSFNSALTNGTVPLAHRPKPLIVLAGSGPGSPSLLTLATHHAIQTADVILADKLVPSAVLDLIPRRTPVHIARKFPGNADAAQQELLEMGLHALEQGQTVLRLKQGDPYIYGRGGEEYVFFREHGYIPVVLPGITSSLSAPLFAAIPPTQRGVADQVLICTGTGRKGAAPEPPRYIKTQTVVFLMALHRLEDLVGSLTGGLPNKTTNGEAVNPDPWPIETPCAVIERASCPDQRVIRSTLEHVVAAVEEEGSRPPGLLVVGWSCEVLMGRRGEKWVTEDGFQGFEELMGRGRAGWEILATVESNGVHDKEVAVDKELQVHMLTSRG